MTNIRKLWLACGLAATSIGAQAAPIAYQIDAGHSTAQFVIGHLGVSRTVGRFNELSGQFSIDSDNPAANQVSVTIQTKSIDTNHEKRDQHLRSPDFLDVKQFPTLTFNSTSFDGSSTEGALNGTLKGDLTLHGVTKPVSLSLTQVGEGQDPWGGYRSGYEASTTINRSDFGVDYFIPGVTDETEITLFIEGIRQ